MFSLKQKKYKYINLFSGIGCWELGLEKLPMENVLSCEINKYARQTFLENFSHLPCIKNNKYPLDVAKIDTKDVPNFDILIASPPCQSFSMAGDRMGLLDKRDDKGNMFFHTLKILKEKRPKAFILENVKGLLSSEKGRSFKIISDLFKNSGYSFNYKIITGVDCGIPQLRQRVFMVGFRGETDDTCTYKFPEPIPLKFTLKDVFNCKTCNREIAHTLLTSRSGHKYGEPFNWRWYLVDGKERILTLQEMQKLMGVRDDFKFPGSFNQTFRQLGNGVIVDCARMVTESVIKYLNKK